LVGERGGRHWEALGQSQVVRGRATGCKKSLIEFEDRFCLNYKYMYQELSIDLSLFGLFSLSINVYSGFFTSGFLPASFRLPSGFLPIVSLSVSDS
jgi:hypothetical protein